MSDKQQPMAIVLKDVAKRPLSKVVDIDRQDDDAKKDDWKNDIYGFECANWTCKC